MSAICMFILSIIRYVHTMLTSLYYIATLTFFHSRQDILDIFNADASDEAFSEEEIDVSKEDTKLYIVCQG